MSTATKNKPVSPEKAKKIVITKAETEKLSRATMLEWFKNKRAKLRALQEALRDATISEREAIREKIVRNTKKELEGMKHLAEKERTRRAEEFAEDVMRVSDEVADLERVMIKYSEQDMQEKLFFGTLDEYVGTDNKKKTLRKLFQTDLVKKTMQIVHRSDKSAYYDIQRAYKKGDYETIKKQMVKSSNGLLTDEKVDHIFAEAVLSNAGKKKLFGIKSFSGLIALLDQIRTVGHGFAMRQTAKKTGIPFIMILKLSGKTYKDFKNMDENLQQHRHLIDMKSERSLNDEERLKFIEGIHTLREKLEKKIESKNLRKDFKKYLEKHLSKRKDLTNEDKFHILTNAKLEDLRMLQLYELAYADDQDRERWFIKSLSRIPTLMRFHKRILGEGSDLVQTYQKYHLARLKNIADWQFHRNAKKWGLSEIVGGIDEIEKISKNAKMKGKASKVTDLFKDAAGGIKVDQSSFYDEKGFIGMSEMYQHDVMVRKYHALVMRATKLMSEKAKTVLNAGRSIEGIQKTMGPSFFKTTVENMPHLSDQSLRAIVPDVKIPIADIRKMTGAQLIAAYGERAVDLRNMQDFTRTRFSALAETIDVNVRQPFQTKWDLKQELVKGTRQNVDIKNKLQDIQDATRPSKGKYYAKRYGLPVIILGAELYALGTGKAKTREVLWDLGEAAAGFVPIAGTVIDFKGAITGKSLSGRNLSVKERWMYAGFGTIGLVADAALVLGGLGAGLRAGIGGLRMARRSVKIGAAAKGAGALRDIALTRQVSVGQRIFGKGALAFDKVHQAEQAVEASIAAKAYEQARLMGKYGNKYKLDGIDDIARVKKLAHADEIRDLDRLHDLMKGSTSGGVSYLQIFNKYLAKAGSLKIPKTFIGRGWLKTKEGFKKMIVFLRTKVGVAPDVLRKYEQSFDALRKAEESREVAVTSMRTAERLRADKLDGLRNAYEIHRRGATQSQRQWMDFLDGHRASVKKEKILSTSFSSAERRYKTLRKTLGEKGLKKADNLVKRGKKLENPKHQEIIETFHSRKKAHESALKDLKTKTRKKSSLEEGKRVKKQQWRKDISRANDELLQTQSTIWDAQKGVRTANDALHQANTTRSMMQMKMMQKADAFVEHGNKVRLAARYMQYAGLTSGLIWMVTGFKYGAVDQAKTVGKAVGTAAKAGHYVTKQVLFTDRSRDALDVVIEKRVKRLKRQKRLNGELAEAQERGKKQIHVYAENWDDPDVRVLARKRGYTDAKVLKYKKKFKVAAKRIEGGAKSMMNKARGAK